MNNIDYIKERLNTLRVYLMMRTLILIAVTSGTISLSLKGAILNVNNIMNILFTMGLTLSIVLFISLVVYDLQIKKLTIKLEN